VCRPRGELDASPRWRFKNRFSETDVFQLRFLVETFTARLAATIVTDAQIGRLTGNVDEMRGALQISDLEASARFDAEFHTAIIDIAGNKLFPEIYTILDEVILEAHRLPLIARGRLWEPVDEHINIINAFEQRDPEGAACHMRLHLMRTAGRSGVDGRFDII